MRRPLEKDVLAACLQLLAARGVMAWRSSNHAVRRTDKAGRQFYAFHGMRGMADICAVVPPSGKLLCIECKKPGGKPSPAQVAFLECVHANGGVSLVVSNVKELDEFLTEILQ